MTVDLPHVSVLIPARNAQEFVATALKTTLRAITKGSEVVIYDDGSSDNTCQVIRQISDERIVLVTGTKNIGVAAGLNKLLDAAKHEIVARMDADDACLPWRFRHQLRKQVSSGGMVFSPAVYVDSKGIPHRPSGLREIEPREAGLQLLEGNPFIHPTMVALKDDLVSLGGYRDIGAEDYDLWMRAAATGIALHRTRIPVLLYRQHGKQVTGRGKAREKRRDEWFQSVDLIESWRLLRSATDGSEFSEPSPGENLTDLMRRRRDLRSGLPANRRRQS